MTKNIQAGITPEIAEKRSGEYDAIKDYIETFQTGRPSSQQLHSYGVGYKAGQASRDAEIEFLRGACIKANPETDKITAIDKAKYDAVLQKITPQLEAIRDEPIDRTDCQLIAAEILNTLKEALND
jgi:hypothetical protein